MSGSVRRSRPGLPPFHDDPRRACRDTDPEVFFPEPCLPGSKAVETAKAICRPCPVRPACLLWATQTHQDWGIWGAATPNERRGTSLPALPPRSQTPFRRVRRSIDVRRIFDAARDHETGGGTLREVAERHGLNRTCLGHAAAVLRHVPHLIPDIEAGWYGLETVYRYAVAVDRAMQGKEAA